MKKSIGLTADISTFNTTLPQTRHLNYFMGTNPRRYASGGDVSQGIPNYPNPNVTNGFLPMALGFAPGGEVKEKDAVTKVYDFIFGYFKNVLGMDDNEAKEKTEETINNSTEEEIENIVQKIPPGGYPGAPSAKSQQTPGIGPRLETSPGLSTGAPKLLMPKDTVTTTPSDRQPQFNLPPSSVPLPKISETPDAPIAPKADEVWPPQEGGITAIPPISEEQKRRDIQEQGGLGIEELKKFKKQKNDGGFNWGDFWKELLPEGTLPDGKQKLPEISPEQEQRDKEDKQQAPVIKTDKKDDTKKEIATKEDQNFIKNSAEFFGKSNQEQMEIANKGGITALDPSKPDKTKKDVPSWALPMMSAGFAMMASKSPYFMQALGEAGQAGVETYSAQKTAEEDRLDKEATREQSRAMAAYYKGEGRQPTSKTMVQNGIVGQIKDGVWTPIINSTTNEPLKQTIGKPEAYEMLKGNVLFMNASQPEQQRMITELIDSYNNTNKFINDKLTEKVDENNNFDLGLAIKDLFNIKS